MRGQVVGRDYSRWKCDCQDGEVKKSKKRLERQPDMPLVPKGKDRCLAPGLGISFCIHGTMTSKVPKASTGFSGHI